jgi:hypothetical protein
LCKEESLNWSKISSPEGFDSFSGHGGSHLVPQKKLAPTPSGIPRCGKLLKGFAGSMSVAMKIDSILASEFSPFWRIPFMYHK